METKTLVDLLNISYIYLLQSILLIAFDPRFFLQCLIK